MPYANRVIHLDFPDISEPDDPIWIKLRNPRFLAPSEVEGSKHANGETEQDDETGSASYKIFAKLVIGWHVYDATDDSENPAPMPIPATVDSVKVLPLEILQKLGEVLAAANPQMQTASPEDGTSKTS